MSPAILPAERLVFGKTGWAIDFHGCAEEVAGVKAVFKGWALASGPPSKFPECEPRAIIRRTGTGWDWQERGVPKARDWDAIPPRTPMRVITDVHDAAIYWYLAEHPHLLCLHGAAVKIGKGLVCFPAKGRAGKSTLTACFAARGHKLFADDVLGLDGHKGLALGFLPRLRSTPAPNLSRATRRFIDRHKGPAGCDWIYLDPGPDRMAKLEETAPISSFVILDRQADGKARLAPARTVEILKLLIAENIVRQLPMIEIFDRLHGLASATANYILRYSDPQDAARLIERLHA